jgi:hypothetical protein
MTFSIWDDGGGLRAAWKPSKQDGTPHDTPSRS